MIELKMNINFIDIATPDIEYKNYLYIIFKMTLQITSETTILF